jgi:hypothetical protein
MSAFHVLSWVMPTPSRDGRRIPDSRITPFPSRLLGGKVEIKLNE